MQLAVELTDAGRALAAPLLADEQARVLTEQRATEVRGLPLVAPGQADEADDRPVALDKCWHMACRGDYVICLDGTTCLKLWNTAGQISSPSSARCVPMSCMVSTSNTAAIPPIYASD